MSSPIPIFIISCNRLSVLRESIDSFKKYISTPLQFIIHDNCSTYVPLLEYFEQLEREGVLIYHSGINVNNCDQLNNISSTINDWYSKYDAPFYIVTDPDIALIPPCDDILELYSYILDTNPSIDVVGPMLRIDDIPDYYPLKSEVVKRHTEQFWHKEPSFLLWKDQNIGFQEALIDTTFGMYRKGYHFHRLSKGLRIYQPYWACHLDWYIDPNNMTEDQIYYLNHASEVSHWGGVWLKKRQDNISIDIPSQHGKFYINSGNDFNENETGYFYHKNNTYYFHQEFILPPNTQSIRFDPVEGCGCFLQDLIIKSDLDEIIDFQICNGFKSENNGIIFITEDPQILINVNEKNTKIIIVECNIWLFSLKTNDTPPPPYILVIKILLIMQFLMKWYLMLFLTIFGICSTSVNGSKKQ